MRRAAVSVVLAVVSAGGAGVASGLALCSTVAPAGADLHAGDRSLVDRYVASFGLDAAQTTLLRAILRKMRDEETDIYRRNRANLPAAVQEELAAARRAADTRIQFMLDPGQRARYEQEQNQATEPGKR